VSLGSPKWGVPLPLPPPPYPFVISRLASHPDGRFDEWEPAVLSCRRPRKIRKKLSASSYNLLRRLGSLALAACALGIDDRHLLHRRCRWGWHCKRQNEKSAPKPTSDLPTNGYVEVVPLTTNGAREVSSAPFQARRDAHSDSGP
jgi:hypothetical protein